MHQTSDIPIVVGGTSYWIQHLLFPDRLTKPAPSEAKDISTGILSDEVQKALKTLPPELLDLFLNLPSEPPIAGMDPKAAFELHSLLKALDEPMAARWHWKDTRKVHRSLCIIKETGRPASHNVFEQSNLISKPRCVSSRSEPRIVILVFHKISHPMFLAAC
jgi:tRNA dimethylallyltransferase